MTLSPSATELRDLDPVQVVDYALSRMQDTGIKLIEWRELLYMRMGVPMLVKNFSYLVPDDDLEAASKLLEDVGLPISIPPNFIVRAEGDFQGKGRFHHITKHKFGFLQQHIALYPLSFSTISLDEVHPQPPIHISPSMVEHVLVPSPSAVYASLMRMMLQYPLSCSTMYLIQSDLSELIGYHLYRLPGFIAEDEDEEWGLDQRIADAVVEAQWEGQWRSGEEWMSVALGEVIAGKKQIEDLPCKSSRESPSSRWPSH